MVALRVQMHLDGNVGFLQRSVVDYRLLDSIHVVISNTRVMPLAVSQPQTSVPSKSMARIWNPPPKDDYNDLPAVAATALFARMQAAVTSN